MTQATSNRTAGAVGSSDGRERKSPKVLMSTETRRSFVTSEFWVALAMAALLVVVGYADDDGLGITPRVGARSRRHRVLRLESRHRQGRIARSRRCRDLDDLR